MVSGAMEMVLTSEMGNTTVASMKIKGLPPGTLLIESWFTVETIAEQSLQLGRFLPLTPTRYLVDPTGKSLSNIVSHEQLNQLCQPIKRRIAQQILQQARGPVETMLEHSEKMALKALPGVVSQAHNDMKSMLTSELDRLTALQHVNKDIRDEEVAYIKERIHHSEAAIASASLVLQAVRVVIVDN